MNTRDEKRSTEVNTERVDDPFVLLRHMVHTADSLAAIVQDADTLDEARSWESRDETFPLKVANGGYA